MPSSISQNTSSHYTRQIIHYCGSHVLYKPSAAPVYCKSEINISPKGHEVRRVPLNKIGSVCFQQGSLLPASSCSTRLLYINCEILSIMYAATTAFRTNSTLQSARRLLKRPL